jgi:hypothetical protein
LVGRKVGGGARAADEEWDDEFEGVEMGKRS